MIQFTGEKHGEDLFRLVYLNIYSFEVYISPYR